MLVSACSAEEEAGLRVIEAANSASSRVILFCSICGEVVLEQGNNLIF